MPNLVIQLVRTINFVRNQNDGDAAFVLKIVFVRRVGERFRPLGCAAAHQTMDRALAVGCPRSLSWKEKHIFKWLGFWEM